MRVGVFFSPILLIGMLGSGAHAQDWYTGSANAQKPSKPNVAIDLSVAGTTQDSYSGTVIGTIAPFAPLEESGFRARLSAVLGSYAYISTAPGIGRVTGKQEQGSFLVGYEWVMRTVSVDAYVGAEVANNTLSANDPTNHTSGMAYGLKGAVNFYANPTSYTMVSGNLSYSTANNGYYSRFKAGLAIFDGVFVGPEALFLGDNQYKQMRFGLHITGFRFGALQFGVSGGYVSDKVRGSGGYGILDARVLF